MALADFDRLYARRCYPFLGGGKHQLALLQRQFRTLYIQLDEFHQQRFLRVKTDTFTEITARAAIGFIQPDDLYLGTFATKFDRHFIECSDRSDIPKVGAMQINRDTVNGFFEIKTVDELLGGGEKKPGP